jgi:hypothetical protein
MAVMARALRTYAGALYSDIWFFLARSKAEAGRVFYEMIPASEQAKTSRKALTRYVAPLCWCPKHERLWFEMTVAAWPRAIRPDLVPAELWGGIEPRAAAEIDEWNAYGGNEPWTVSLADLRRGDGLCCAFVDAAAHVPFDRGALTRNDSAAPRIARTIYETGDFSSLPILADALEEAGCGSALLLDHCRKPAKHHPGCWVVELVLSKG